MHKMSASSLLSLLALDFVNFNEFVAYFSLFSSCFSLASGQVGVENGELVTRRKTSKKLTNVQSNSTEEKQKICLSNFFKV